MKFLALFALWATVAFVPIQSVAPPYQNALAAVAARIASPPGREIEIEDVEVFFPFDLGVFVALCLASTWASWRRRLRAIALGLPPLVLIEVAALTAALLTLMRALSQDAGAIEAAQRYAFGLIRITGLVAAAAAWFWLLGRERVPLPGHAAPRTR